MPRPCAQKLEPNSGRQDSTEKVTSLSMLLPGPVSPGLSPLTHPWNPLDTHAVHTQVSDGHPVSPPLCTRAAPCPLDSAQGAPLLGTALKSLSEEGEVLGCLRVLVDGQRAGR